jgi:hypothetical protein
MRLNSARSMKLGEAVYRKYGSWDAVFANAEYKNGKYVLREPMTAKDIQGDEVLKVKSDAV